MSTHVVAMRVSGVDLLVEASPITAAGPQPTSTLGEAAKRVLDGFDRAEEAIVAVASKVAGTVNAWSTGARLMWEIASPIDESSPITRYLLDQGWAIEAGAKLFVHVNHSDVLKEFVRVVGSQFSSDERYLLPRGR